MHILFLTHYFPPEVNAPASRTYEHAVRWVPQPDVRVTVLTNHPNHPAGVLFPAHRNRWFQRETMSGISVVRVKTLLAANAGVVWRTLNYLFYLVAAVLGSFAVRKPDLVVATSPQFFCALAGYVVSRIKRRPFVFELRDLWPDSIVAVGAMRPSLAIRCLEKLELFLYRRAAHIVAVTNSFKENLVRRGIPAAKISVIKNGVDLSRFQPRPVPAALRQELGAEGKTIISYIGTVGLAHALDCIVDTAALLREEPDLLFLIVGEGADKARIESLVSAAALPNLKVLPGVDKDRVLDFYAVTDLNLVTLRAQPVFASVIPSKIFEIMGMSRPILTTVDGESRRIITAAGAGMFVAPENAKALAETIRALCRRPDMLRDMGERGRAYVQENCDRSCAAQSYLELLRELHRLVPKGTGLMAGAGTNPFSASHPDNDLCGPTDGLFKLIRSDYRRYRASGASAIGTILCTQGFWASAVYRLHHHLVRRCPWPVARSLARALGLVLQKVVEIFTGISLPGGLRASAGLYIGHFGNIIVSPEARLGRNCNLSQGITIGVAGRGRQRGAPVLGDRVFVGAGAILLGPIHIGDDVAIGAGAVVTKSIPARAVVVGNPARVISERGSFDFVSYDRMEADPARRPGESSPASLAPVSGLEWREENSRAVVPENEAQSGDGIKNF